MLNGNIFEVFFFLLSDFVWRRKKYHNIRLKRECAHFIAFPLNIASISIWKNFHSFFFFLLWSIHPSWLWAFRIRAFYNWESFCYYFKSFAIWFAFQLKFQLRRVLLDSSAQQSSKATLICLSSDFFLSLKYIFHFYSWSFFFAISLCQGIACNRDVMVAKGCLVRSANPKRKVCNLMRQINERCIWCKMPLLILCSTWKCAGSTL